MNANHGLCCITRWLIVLLVVPGRCRFAFLLPCCPLLRFRFNRSNIFGWGGVDRLLRMQRETKQDYQQAENVFHYSITSLVAWVSLAVLQGVTSIDARGEGSR